MYFVEVTPTAEKDIFRLPSSIQDRFETIIDRFNFDPRPNGCKKLKGLPNIWRVRIGDYRILYSINDKLKHITIYRILHRKDVYR